MPIPNEVLAGIGVVAGGGVIGVVLGLKSKLGRDVQQMRLSVETPMKEIADNVTKLVTKVEVIETTVQAVQAEQAEMKREGLAASIERRDVIKELSFLRGVEEGKRSGNRRQGERA